MLRLSLALVFSGLMLGTSIAAECSTSLREDWSVAAGELIEFNRQVMKARNMGEAYDRKLLCTSAKKIPGVTKLAKEYFYACDPISAPREVASFEQLNEIADRYNRTRCLPQEQTMGGRGNRPSGQ